MTDKDRQQPRVTAGGARRAEARQDRLARALRENLMKRKAQSRAREAADASASDGLGDSDPTADRGSSG